MATYDAISNKIQDEFMKLFAKKQLHDITVKELCAQVGIAWTAFYNYYSDVYDVLETVENLLIYDLKELNGEFYNADIRGNQQKEGFFKKTLMYIKERDTWFRALLNKSRDGQFIYKWTRIIKEDFSRRYHHEKIVLENETLVLEMIASSAIGVYMYWVNNLDEVSMDVVEKEALFRLCSDFV